MQLTSKMGRGKPLACVALGLLIALVTPLEADASGPAEAYQQARAGYFELKGSKSKQRFRHHWFGVISQFDSVRRAFPETDEACRAAFTSAELWSDLHAVSGVRSDLNRALDGYEDVANHCPKSSLADDSLWAKAQLLINRAGRVKDGGFTLRRLLDNYPAGDMAPRARRLVAERKVRLPKQGSPKPKMDRGKLRGRTAEAPVALEVIKMRTWTTSAYARVALYITKPCEFRSGTLRAAPGGARHERVYVDILGADLKPGFEVSSPKKHDLISQVRVGTPDKDKLRVVFDLAAEGTKSEVVVLENPYRIVIDITQPRGSSVAKSAETVKPSRPVVVLDPGHGGKDSGAVGHGGVLEKIIALKLSKEVKSILDKKGIDTILTRQDDTFLSLEERTAKANGLNADIFVSIHANAHKDSSVHGIETYYLDVTNDRYSIRLAAVENKVREERVSELQLALAELSSRLFTEQSASLARSIQDSLVTASRKTRKTRDLGVKSSLFYVLLGTRMPAVLVEAGFISNPSEQKALASSTYRSKLAGAIASGIIDHLNTKREDGS